MSEGDALYLLESGLVSYEAAPGCVFIGREAVSGPSDEVGDVQVKLLSPLDSLVDGLEHVSSAVTRASVALASFSSWSSQGDDCQHGNKVGYIEEAARDIWAGKGTTSFKRDRVRRLMEREGVGLMHWPCVAESVGLDGEFAVPMRFDGEVDGYVWDNLDEVV